MNDFRCSSPGSISLIFKVVENPVPLNRVSVGISFTTDLRCQAAYDKEKPQAIFYNGKKIRVESVEYVFKHFNINSGEMYFETEMPISSGFGLSASMAINAAFLLNKSWNLKVPDPELFLIAHKGDVSALTGLGDVATQSKGGLCLRVDENNPFNIISLEAESFYKRTLYFKYFDKLSTKNILSDKNIKEKIGRSADRVLKKIIPEFEKLNIETLLDLSCQFAKEAELIQNSMVSQDISKIIQIGGHATMIMLGNSILSTIPLNQTYKEVKISSLKGGLFD